MMRRNKVLAYLAGGGVLLGWILGVNLSARADEIPEKYRESVKKGLEYLAKAQSKDGHWGASPQSDQYPIAMTGLAGEPVRAAVTVAPGNGQPFGGIKVASESGWFAARPSGTEDVYKIYAESFRSQSHLRQIQEEAQAAIAQAFAG